jgi:hypothetical protein
MARALDAESGDAFTGRTSELRGKEKDPQPDRVGFKHCRSKGNAAASAGAAGSFYETTGRRKQRLAAGPPPSCRYRRTFPRTTGRPGAGDAAVDSAGAAVPYEGPRAGRIRQMAIPECTAAGRRHSGSGQTRQSDALDFGPSFYTPIDRQGSGLVAQ